MTSCVSSLINTLLLTKLEYFSYQLDVIFAPKAGFYTIDIESVLFVASLEEGVKFGKTIKCSSVQ